MEYIVYRYGYQWGIFSKTSNCYVLFCDSKTEAEARARALNKPDPKLYLVTLLSDQGRRTIETAASSPRAAAEIVCKAENAPTNAVTEIHLATYNL
jgi:hypothetical protein